NQRLVSTGVEPGDPARQFLDVQLAPLEIHPVDVGNLQLATRRWFETGGDVDDLVVVEIQPRDGKHRLRLRRLLFDTDGTTVAIELDHTVAFWIADLVAEDRRPGLA